MTDINVYLMQNLLKVSMMVIFRKIWNRWWNIVVTRTRMFQLF